MPSRAFWFLLAAAMLFAPAAHARRSCWGDFERADYVAYVVPEKTKRKPEIIVFVHPHLSRVLVFHCFWFPYSVSDGGYVLTTSDRSGPWTPVTTDEIAELQRAGRLPDPLPPFDLSWGDWLFGHLLWFVPIVSVLCTVIGRALVRRRDVRMRA